MAISRVTTQDASNIGGQSTSASYPATPTQGNLLIAIQAFDDISTSGLTNSGWSYAFRGGSGNDFTNVSVLYKVAGASEPTTITTVTNSSATTTYLIIYEYTGFTGTPTLDKAALNGDFFGSTTHSTGTTATTTAAAELLIAAVQLGGSATFTSWSNSFTNQRSIAQTVYSSDKIVSATGAYETTLTVGTVRSSGAGIATFKDVAGSSNTLSTDAFNVGLATVVRNLASFGVGV